MSCPNPRVTRKVVNPGTGPLAWCGKCQAWKPAAQVSWARMTRRSTGAVSLSFAPVPH